MDIFQQRLRDLRKEKKFTQKEFADKLQTTDDSIFSWEKGRSEPSIEMIRRICAIFNISADYLIGLENDDGSRIESSYEFEYRHDNTILKHKEKKNGT